MAISFENSEKSNPHLYQKYGVANSESLSQLLSYDNYALDSYLIQEENTSRENVKKQNDNSKDSVKASIPADIERLIKYENLKVQKDFSEKPVQANTSMSSQVHKESEFSEENTQAIRTDEAENYLLKSEYFNQKLDCPDEKICQYHPFQDNCLQEILCSMLYFIRKEEENSSSCLGILDLSNSALEFNIKDKHSEPDCVKSIRILLHFLKDIQRDLHIKENEASQLKLCFEAHFNELNLFYNLDSTKEHVGKEFYNINSLIDSSCKLLDNIKKERAECDWYYMNLQNMMNFLQQNCSSINHWAL